MMVTFIFFLKRTPFFPLIRVHSQLITVRIASLLGLPPLLSSLSSKSIYTLSRKFLYLDTSEVTMLSSLVLIFILGLRVSPLGRTPIS